MSVIQCPSRGTLDRAMHGIVALKTRPAALIGAVMDWNQRCIMSVKHAFPMRERDSPLFPLSFSLTSCTLASHVPLSKHSDESQTQVRDTPTMSCNPSYQHHT